MRIIAPWLTPWPRDRSFKPVLNLNQYAPVMLRITCSGTPYEIGFEHGRSARTHIERSIRVYASMFEKKVNLGWPQACQKALEFAPFIQENFPEFSEEIKGIADGCGLTYADILALNVRTEIRFGLINDGCTAIARKTSEKSFLAQNWDWVEAQKDNLFVITIHQQSKPSICMVTEAGIIGKIGFNSNGIGVCLNAITVHGTDPTHLPVHLALRAILDSDSLPSALHALERHGLASAAHILVADPSTNVGLECTTHGIVKLLPDEQGRVTHTNHLLAVHPAGVKDLQWWKDSFPRVDRIKQLTEHNPEQSTPSTVEELSELFKDEDGYPTSICRAQVTGKSDAATLFHISMDLGERKALVVLGRPVEPEESIIVRL